MPRSSNTIHVWTIPGEPFCYKVESWEKPSEPHRVELLEQMGNGACSCVDWTTRCLPNWRRNGQRPVDYWMIKANVARPNPARSRCRHIMAALRKEQNDRLLLEAQKEARLDPDHRP